MKLYLSILLLLSSAVGHAAQDSALPSNFQIYISQGFTLVPRAVFKSPCFRLYVDGKAVGDLRWSKLNDTDIQIDSLYVVPEFRRHGYANVLLEYGLTVLAKDFKKAVLKVHPFERVDDKVTGM